VIIPVSTSFSTRRLDVNVPGRPRPIDFRYFAHSQRHVMAILQGETYPEVKKIGSVRTVIDIGANVGSAAVCFAVRYPGAVIHAFEPGMEARGLLVHNAASCPAVRIHAVGLHDHDAAARLFRSKWDPMSASVGRNYENTEDSEAIEVRRASAYLQEIGVDSIDVLKVDTEGCELPILRDLGALARDAVVIHLEYHSEADRVGIDSVLNASHLLYAASATHPHRGDLTYVRADSDAAACWAAAPIELPRSP
jgi:FkbM family methyltransferase